jgi:hypothetical protein
VNGASIAPPNSEIQMNTISDSRVPYFHFHFHRRPAPLRSVHHLPTMVRLGGLRQSLLLPRLRPYSQLAHKELDPQLNGYPQLPNVSRQSLPPSGWWDFQMRRNRGDTV